MAKIAWNDVPAWARKEIEKAGKRGMTQISTESATLQVMNGVATFNGRTVAAPGVVVDPADNVEETVDFASLPGWAKQALRGSRGSNCNMINGNASLQISGETARFNGALVVYGKATGGSGSRWGWLRYLRYLWPF